MTLTITGELEASLLYGSALAKATPEEYALEVLRHELLRKQHDPVISVSSASADEVEQMFSNLAQRATPVRNYPDDFFSREVIYADHD